MSSDADGDALRAAYYRVADIAAYGKELNRPSIGVLRCEVDQDGEPYFIYMVPFNESHSAIALLRIAEALAKLLAASMSL